MRKFVSLLFGPKAWLVWLNLLVSLVAAIPFLLQILLSLLAKGRITTSEWALLPMGLMVWALAAIGEGGYVLCVPALLPAIVLLPAMLVTPKISWWLKLVTALVELAAFVLLFHTLDALKAQARHSPY